MIKPDRECAKTYVSLYRIFNQAYHALEPVYGELASYRMERRAE